MKDDISTPTPDDRSANHFERDKPGTAARDAGAATEELRARAEAALRESEERRTLALEATQVGTFVWHVQEDRGEPDARMLALFDQPPDGTLSLRDAIATMIHPDDAQRYADAVAEAARPDGSRELREDIRVRNGEDWRWVAITARVSFDDEGRPLRMAGTGLDITERKRAEAASRESEARQAFLLKLSDALRPLADPLEIQSTAVTLLGEHLGVDRALYAEFIQEDGQDLVLVEREYLTSGTASFAGKHPTEQFGADLHVLRAGQTIAIADSEVVAAEESERQAWRALGTRARLGLPLIKGGRLVAGIGVHSRAPREWDEPEISLLAEVGERTWAAVERARSETELATELRRAEVLQSVSSQLIKEGDGENLYDKIIDAGMTIMDAQFGSLQLLDDGELKLIAWRNFHPDSAAYWNQVSVTTGTSCGSALAHGERVIIPDVDECETLKGTGSLREYQRSGIKAVQSTPLTRRNGQVIGMMSTHWREAHVPDERELRLFDVLARQAADFIERERAEAALRESERHAQTLLAELQHRVRNTLTVVRSIARRTAETSANTGDMLAHFQGRLDAFSRVQAAVTRSADGKVSLASLIDDELVAHAARGGEQIKIEGPDVSLDAKTAERLSLAIHELATNAVKHGALANGHGQVRIDWLTEGLDGSRELMLRWVESGVKTNGGGIDRSGFGMELLRQSLPYDLRAQTKVDLTPRGLRFELRMPLLQRGT
jgi:two-component sensor histidine kinase/PAS domain-containing protein